MLKLKGKTGKEHYRELITQKLSEENIGGGVEGE